MTPIEIEVALKFHYDPMAHIYFGSQPAYQNAILNLIDYKLLQRSPSGWVEPANGALSVYIEALCNVPLPVKGWIMP